MTTTSYFGPPGTGKTFTLMNVVSNYLEQGSEPERIGFVSFSKKATEEARNRAASELNLDYKRMPYFRTLHSLAFRQLNLKIEDVMRGADYRRLEEMIGMEFISTSSMSLNDGEFFRMGSKGDMYLGVYNMARVRGIPVEQQFHETANFSLRLNELEHIVRSYEDYKQAAEKIDFTDMIRLFIENGEAPKLDALIVDEAQDLVPLQWQMVDKLTQNASDVFYAGDDDQAIYEWMGVNPKDFIERSMDTDNQFTLGQSFRVPQEVHKFATSITDSMHTRIDKAYEPREEPGSVSYHYDIDELDLQNGEWMILCRTNYIANKLAGQLKTMGHLFWRTGNGWSVSSRTLNAVRNWTKLTRGESLGLSEFQELWTMLKIDRYKKRAGNKKIKEAPKGDMLEDARDTFDMKFVMDILGEDVREKIWYEILDVQARERVYITSVLESGEKFDDDNPRIVLSTIHKAKGGEADNVALFLQSSKACCTMGDPDCERRVFYVGATRAKQNLHIIESRDARWSFRI